MKEKELKKILRRIDYWGNISMVFLLSICFTITNNILYGILTVIALMMLIWVFIQEIRE